MATAARTAQKIGFMSENNAFCTCVLHFGTSLSFFFFFFLPFPAKQQRQMIKLKVLWKKGKHATVNFPFTI